MPSLPRCHNSLHILLLSTGLQHWLCGQAACGYTNRVCRAMSFHSSGSFQGESTVWDMQHYFTSCLTVRMLLKSLVDVLPGKGPSGALPPSLAHFQGFCLGQQHDGNIYFSTEICEYHQVKILNSAVSPFSAPTRSDVPFVFCSQGNADYVIYGF